jgi:hypothetical protein
MSKAKTPAPIRDSQDRASEPDRSAELRMLAAKIDELVATTGVAALDAALALAQSGDPAGIGQARSLADDLATRSNRLEQDIGRTLLSARIN